jgi:hypothetical protein
MFFKILSAGNELFEADGQTDMTKLIVAFYNFLSMPKNVLMPLVGSMGNAEGAFVTFEKNCCLQISCVGKDGSVGIATRYGLEGPGIQSRLGARLSCFGAHISSYKTGTGSLSRK